MEVPHVGSDARYRGRYQYGNNNHTQLGRKNVCLPAEVGQISAPQAERMSDPSRGEISHFLTRERREEKRI